MPGTTFFPNLSTFITFAAAPLVSTPIVRNQMQQACKPKVACEHMQVHCLRSAGCAASTLKSQATAYPHRNPHNQESHVEKSGDFPSVRGNFALNNCMPGSSPQMSRCLLCELGVAGARIERPRRYRGTRCERNHRDAICGRVRHIRCKQSENE